MIWALYWYLYLMQVYFIEIQQVSSHKSSDSQNSFTLTFGQSSFLNCIIQMFSVGITVQSFFVTIKLSIIISNKISNKVFILGVLLLVIRFFFYLPFYISPYSSIGKLLTLSSCHRFKAIFKSFCYLWVLLLDFRKNKM